jgi:alpha-ketoglutarate-dependent taurine dioxygenase
MTLGNEFSLAIDSYLKNKNNSNLNDIKKKFKNIKNNFLNKNKKYLIVRNFSKNKNELIKKINTFSKFTRLLKQNSNGDKIIEVKPHFKLLKKFKKKTKENLRYHQTNLGGSIHSDGPQLSTPPKYIVMACSQQARTGGDSIISDAKKIYHNLRLRERKIIQILNQKFFFERRGFKYKKKVFNKKIFDTQNQFIFRYLRDYIESGHKIVKKKLTVKQKNALSILDKYLENKNYQITYRLNKNDLVILNNFCLAHGRKQFQINNRDPRTLYRLWIKN